MDDDGFATIASEFAYLETVTVALPLMNVLGEDCDRIEFLPKQLISWRKRRDMLFYLLHLSESWIKLTLSEGYLALEYE